MTHIVRKDNSDANKEDGRMNRNVLNETMQCLLEEYQFQYS